MENGEPSSVPRTARVSSRPRTRAGVGVGNGSDPLLLSADTGRTEQLECGNLLQLGPLRLCLSSSERTQTQVPAPARGHVRAELSFSSAVASSSVFFFKTKKTKKKALPQWRKRASSDSTFSGSPAQHCSARVLQRLVEPHSSPSRSLYCTRDLSCYILQHILHHTTAHACRVSVVSDVIVMIWFI